MLATILLIFFIQNIAIGALLGRIDGGGLIKCPNLLEKSLISAYLVFACLPFADWFALLAFAGFAGIATGHGLYFLSMRGEAASPEFFDFLLVPFFGKDPRTKSEFASLRGLEQDELTKEQIVYLERAIVNYGAGKLYWRCVCGMGITGAIWGLPAAILAICFGAWPQAILFLLTGPIKAAAYAISWQWFGSTVQAEYINGGGRTAVVLMALIIGVMKIYGF